VATPHVVARRRVAAGSRRAARKAFLHKSLLHDESGTSRRRPARHVDCAGVEPSATSVAAAELPSLLLPSRMRLLSRLALAASAAVVPVVASAQPTLAFDASQPNAFSNGSYYVGPFNGTFTTAPGQSTALSIFCVDILNTVGFGDTFPVKVTSLADGADLSNTRHPGMLTQYREAAWISSYFSIVPQAGWGSMQYAMWGLLNPGSAPTDAYSPSIIAAADYAASQNFHAFTYNSSDYAAFDYSKYSVLTDVRAAGSADDGFEQEFITGDLASTATPEPATLVLTAGGLLIVYGVTRRKRTIA
jgi:hypothetical protein